MYIRTIGLTRERATHERAIGRGCGVIIGIGQSLAGGSVCSMLVQVVVEPGLHAHCEASAHRRLKRCRERFVREERRRLAIEKRHEGRDCDTSRRERRMRPRVVSEHHLRQVSGPTVPPASKLLDGAQNALHGLVAPLHATCLWQRVPCRSKGPEPADSHLGSGSGTVGL